MADGGTQDCEKDRTWSPSRKAYCLDCQAVGMSHCHDFTHCGGAVFPDDPGWKEPEER